MNLSNTTTFVLLAALLTVSACTEDAPRADAYGNFEVPTTVISAKASGQLLSFNVDEGLPLKAGQLIGLIDTTSLHLQRKQLLASIGTLPQKLQDTRADIRVLQDQRSNLEREVTRVTGLLAKEAATPKQLDDLTGQVTVINQQIKSLTSRQNTANRAILSEKQPLLAQVDIIEQQIRDSYVYNPTSGRVLTKMAEPFEVVGRGSPLYRIANTDTMTLRAYISGQDLSRVRLGESVKVLIDGGAGLDSLAGRVSWVSEQAEFTPSPIQTREDRTNLVYAIKVDVANPKGTLKIGMPGEVWLQ